MLKIDQICEVKTCLPLHMTIPIANITTILDEEGFKLAKEGDDRWYVFSG